MCKGLITYIRANYPIIEIDSIEEGRVKATIAGYSQGPLKGRKVVHYSITAGFTNPDGTPVKEFPKKGIDSPLEALEMVEEASGKTIFVMLDFHVFLDPASPINVPTIRKLREVGQRLKDTGSGKTIVLLGPKKDLPPGLAEEVASIEWPLPKEADLEKALNEVKEIVPDEVKKNLPADLSPIVQAALGQTLDGFQNCLARCAVMTRTFDPLIVADEKKQAIRKSGALEWMDTTGGLEVIGGLERLKAWLVERKLAFSPAARDYGLEAPKGAVIMGPPGTGKSAAAKAVAAAWGVPIIRLDFGALFGSYLGESEANMRKALKVFEALGRCICFADEMDKGLGGSAGDGSTSDGGASSRVLGTFLTWMQEKTCPTFVLGTINRTDGLPPELLRKGRWDEFFFVDLPHEVERRAIFEVHLAKRKRDPKKFDIAELAKVSLDMSGAEIEAAVVAGMFRAFADGAREVTTVDIKIALEETVPLAKMEPAKMEKMRSWAKGRARPASLPPEEKSEAAGRFSGLEIN
jgi:ATP-dependent 26S proteasome regulatory subunit